MEQELKNFKKLLEYFVAHLEWNHKGIPSGIGYETYIKPLLDKKTFKRTGQGYDGASIQSQIRGWDEYSIGKVCINVQANFGSYKSVKCYLNWLHTGINILSKWENETIIALYQDEFIFWEEPTRRVNYNKEYTLQELKLFEDGEISNELKDFFETFKSRYQVFLNNEEKEKLMVTIYKSKELLIHKKQIILQGPPGTGKTREAKLIALEMLGLNEVNDLKDNEQFKLLQFHPSYTYEDFVRGIVSKPNPEGEGVVYETENKTLGKFALKAFNNYLASKGENRNNDFTLKLNSLIENINNELVEGKNYKFADKSTAEIFSLEKDYFLYNFPQRVNIRYKLLFSDLEKLYNRREEIKIPIDIRDNEFDLGLEMKGKYPYYFMLLKQLEALETSDDNVKENETLKNYVLVIDEINRANLSSVLGELIYALEYRGEAVTSMYNVDNKDLILPPNLYIIGTMNTADRSVGHIDYAIRRRFAFVDVLPKDLSIDKELVFDLELFNEVAKLFETNLSPEFDKKEVQLGHSYFIQQYEKDKNGKDDKQKPINFELRLEYEIKPILLEYVKDGVLVGEDIKQKINDLTVSI